MANMRMVTAVAAMTLFASAADAVPRYEVVLSETDVQPPGPIFFRSPTDGCRYVGTVTEGARAYDPPIVVTWSFHIDSKICNGVMTTPADARVFPGPPPEAPRPSGLVLSIGQQAVLVVDDAGRGGPPERKSDDCSSRHTNAFAAYACSVGQWAIRLLESNTAK